MKLYIVIIIVIISIVVLMKIFNSSPRETDAEAAKCMQETGNIYCNGPKGD